jgi:serine protease Do
MRPLSIVIQQQTTLVRNMMIRKFLAIALLSIGISSQLNATDFSRSVDKVSAATVVIYTKESMEQITDAGLKTTSSQGLGSGVVISTEGDILTASHVVNIADDIMVQFSDGETYPARVISSVSYADIAMIRLLEKPKKLHTVKLGNSDKLKTGQELFVIGAPYGLQFSFTAGHFSGRRITEDPITKESLEFLQTDAPINQGNSGGPLFDKSGRLMGIVSHIQSQSGGNEGLGFAASINMVKSLLIERPPIWIGADVLPLEGESAKALNIAEDEGFLVQRVAANSWAEKAGLRGGTIPVTVDDHGLLLGGDIVIAIGGHAVYSTQAGLNRVRTYMEGVPEGENIKMTIIRGGERIEIKAPKPVF